MAINVYLMPSVGTGTGGSHGDPFRAKYADNLIFNDVGFTQIKYGDEPTWLVIAWNIVPALHSTIAADSTCITVPDLVQTVGAQLTQVQNVLESMSVPADWLQASHSYASVVRFVAIFFLLFDKLQAQGAGRLFTGTVTLDTRFNQLPASMRTQLQTMAQSFNFDTSSLVGTNTIRQILKALADQWLTISLQFGDVVL